MNLMVVKTAFKLLAMAGAGTVIENAIVMNTPALLSVAKKGLVGVGTLVLSAMVADKAGEYIDQKYDEIVKSVKDKLPKS